MYRTNPEWRERKKAYHRKNEKKKRADPVWNAVALEKLREKRRTNHEWRTKTLAAVNARRRRLVGFALAIEARTRSKRKGREFTINPQSVQTEWETSPSCRYCGKIIRIATGKHDHDSPTLDRLDTMLGYVPGNTVLACFRCNTLKRDATFAEMETLVANWRRVLTIHHTT